MLKDVVRGAQLSNYIRFFLGLQIVVLALAFLPLYPLSFVKFGALIFSTLLLLALVLIDAYRSQKIPLPSSKLDGFVYSVSIIYFLAAVVGQNPSHSLFGYGLVTTFSVVSMLCLLVIYLVIRSYVTTFNQIRNLIAWVVATTGLSALLYFISTWTDVVVSVTSTSQNSYVVVAAIASLIASGGYFYFDKRWIKILCSLIGGVLFIYAFTINSLVAGLLTAPALLITLIFITRREALIKRWVSVSIVGLLLFSTVSLFIPFMQIVPVPTFQETTLPVSVSYTIAKSAVADNILLGIGPQNFADAFYQYKPQALNATSLWNEGFTRSGATAIEFVISTGLLGLLSYLTALVGISIAVVRRLQKWNVAHLEDLKGYMLTVTLFGLYIGTHIVALFHDYTLFELLIVGSIVGALIQVTVGEASQKQLTSTSRAILAYIGALVIILSGYYAGTAFSSYSYIDVEEVSFKEIESRIKNNPQEILHYTVGVQTLILENTTQENPEESVETQISELYDEALEHASRTSDYRNILESMRYVYEKTDQTPQQWSEVMNELRERDPQNPLYDSLDAQLLYQTAQTPGLESDVRTGLLAQAQVHVNAALEKQKNNPDLYIIQGDIVYAQQELEAARGAYLIAYSARPQSLNINARLVSVLKDLEQKEEARAVISAYEKNNPDEQDVELLQSILEGDVDEIYTQETQETEGI